MTTEPHAIPDPAAPAVAEEPARPSVVKRIFAALIPVGICLVGVAFAGLMVATRPEAERTEQENLGLPVRTRALTPGTQAVRVQAQGQVVAARRVVMQPELNGRVVAMNENLIPGGRLAEGDTLVRIDPRDFRAALEQQRAQLENSRVQLTQEESRRVIAEREWALLGRGSSAASDDGRALALRQPQVRSAEASLRAARSGLSQAQTQLSRTTLRAPFDALVQAESVDIGQLVGPATQVATLVGTAQFWVQVSVPLASVQRIQIPGFNAEVGSSARIYQDVGDGVRVEREGRVIRLLGDLDPVGRMARVLVEIDDPLGLQREDPGLPILIGAFVHVDIDAGQLDEVYEVPRENLHVGDVVHLFGEGHLAVREVDVVWRRADTVLVRGLEPNAELVLSPIAVPVEGTQLRRVEEPAVERPSRPPEAESPEPAPAEREG
ncbi:MAG TPA: hypothetical protein DEF51_32435 [Myxococcales bacterium]|nr:hypothetical protein [Myxococcales bacterium]